MPHSTWGSNVADNGWKRDDDRPRHSNGHAGGQVSRPSEPVRAPLRSHEGFRALLEANLLYAVVGAERPVNTRSPAPAVNPTPKPEVKVLTPPTGAQGERVCAHTVRRQSLSDATCAICLEPILAPLSLVSLPVSTPLSPSATTAPTPMLSSSAPDAVNTVFCKSSCGQSMHLPCFTEYAEHAALAIRIGRQGHPLQCPICRSLWQRYPACDCDQYSDYLAEQKAIEDAVGTGTASARRLRQLPNSTRVAREARDVAEDFRSQIRELRGESVRDYETRRARNRMPRGWGEESQGAGSLGASLSRWFGRDR